MSRAGSGSAPTGPFKGPFDAWNAAFVAAGVVVSVLAAFVVPPPFSVGTHEMLPALGKFVVAVIIAAVIAPFLRYSSHRYWPIWSVLSVATLIVGVTLLFWYLSLGSHYVRHHQRADGADVEYVIDSSFTPTGQRIFDALRTPTKTPSAEDMIKHAAGNTFEERQFSIWDRDVVTLLELKLALVYLGLFVCFSAILFFAAQALRTATTK